MADTRGRIRFLDVAKGLGILMVTFGHVTELSNPVDNYMSLYKITIFYFTSGYLLSYLNKYKETGYGKYFGGVFRHIAVPYFVFCILSTLLRTFRAWLRYKDVEEEFFLNVRLTVTLQGVATMWFLPTIFIAQILLFILVKNGDRIIAKIALLSVAFWPAGVFWYLDHYQPEFGIKTVLCKGIIATWFMAAGFMYHKLIQDHVDPRLRFVFGVALSAFTVWLSQYSMGIDFNMMEFGEIPSVFFIGGITGSLGVLLVFEGLEHFYVPKFLEYWGKNSLILMCSQRGLLLLNLIFAGWGSYYKLTEVVCKRFYLERICILIFLLLTVYGLVELIEHFKKSWRERKQLAEGAA